MTATRTAFVAGATGYTGRQVVRACVEHGLRTVAHVRPDSRQLDRWKTQFAELGAEVDTTAWQAESMADTLKRLAPGVVFALLGTTRARGREAPSGGVENYETVDYGLSVLLLNAAATCGASPRFVYLSSAGVSERARGAYLGARWRVEEAIRASGLPFTIARPSFITGPDRDEERPGERIGAAVADAGLAVLARLGGRRLRARYGSTTNVVLADALVRLALDEAAADSVVESEGLR